jgi:hypothetical protein
MNRKTIISSIITAIFLIFLPVTTVFAHAGCCSSHGGVAGCGSSGFSSCKDGTDSPTCKCDGTSAAKTSKSSKSSSAAATTSSAPAAAAADTAPTKTAKSKSANSTVGCCSGHGGVDKCNAKAGYQKCKDGSLSTTCTCGKSKKS